jgi:hypothetical protein
MRGVACPQDGSQPSGTGRQHRVDEIRWVFGSLAEASRLEAAAMIEDRGWKPLR